MKLRKIASLVGLVVAGAMVLAPQAQATDMENTMFLQSLIDKGWVFTNVNVLLAQGNSVCDSIDSIPGWTGGDSAGWFYNNTSYTWEESVSLVTSAVWSICPEFLPGGWANLGPPDPAPYPEPPAPDPGYLA